MSTALVNSSHSAKKQSLRRYDMRGIMKKTSFITSGPNLNHTLRWQLFQAGYWFSEPLSDSLLPPPLLRPLPKYKGISDPRPHPQSQCTVCDSQQKLREDSRPRSGLLVRSLHTTKGCCDRVRRAPVTLLGAPTVATGPHHSLLKLWGSKGIFDLQMLWRACASTGDTVRLKKSKARRSQAKLCGHDRDSQFHFQMLPEPSQKGFGDD